jgi:hypothetical protein
VKGSSCRLYRVRKSKKEQTEGLPFSCLPRLLPLMAVHARPPMPRSWSFSRKEAERGTAWPATVRPLHERRRSSDGIAIGATERHDKPTAHTAMRSSRAVVNRTTEQWLQEKSKPARKGGTPSARCILRFFGFDPCSLDDSDVAVNRNIREDLEVPLGWGQ